MNPETALQLFGEAFWMVVVIVMVIVGPSLAVGLIVSTFQAATQINEQTLSFLPRLIITLLTIMYTGPWLLQKFMDLFTNLALLVPEIISQ